MSSTPACLQQRLEFPLPARKLQGGLPLANPAFGALAWGEGSRVRLALDGAAEDGSAPAPAARLPLGRVELQLPPDWFVDGGGLHLLTGEAEIELAGPRASAAKVRASVLRETPVLCLRITGLPGDAVRVASCPAELPGAPYGRTPGVKTQAFDLGEFGGWVQERAGEPAACVGWLRLDANGGLLLFVTSVNGPTPADARRRALATLETVRAEGYTPATLRGFAWWRRWWEQAPAVFLPDPELERRCYLELYRLAGQSDPEDPQAEAAGGAAEVLEMLLRDEDGVLRVFPAVPETWREARFERLRAAGGFRVAAAREGGRTARVEVSSEAGGALRLANPWRDGTLELRAAPGETLLLRQG
jgi:hypothetical protein